MSRVGARWPAAGSLGSQRSRPAHARAACVATFALIVLGTGASRAPAQGNITDAELEDASNGRIVRVGSVETGHLTVMPLEVYVARVLGGEGEPGAAGAAQQALAVAIRTFALANAGRHRRDGYELCDGTHCQVLRAATPATRRATLATAGQFLAFEGRPAEVFYSASCGGQSESAADVWPGGNYSYLRSAVDDVHEDDAPWIADITLREVQSALARVGFEGRRLTGVQAELRSGSGRVTRLRVEGLEPDVIAGEQFRAALGAVRLRSTAFTMTRAGETLRFTGRGYGHGVGLCVIGAGRRATRGESLGAILGQYFPGLVVSRLDGQSARLAMPVPPALRPSPPAAAAPVAVPAPAAAAVAPRSSGITVRVPRGSTVAAADIERIAVAAHRDLSRLLGTSEAPVEIELHDTLDGFRLATGRPWWVSAVVVGTSVDLAPLPVLQQRDGLDLSIRMAIAERLMSSALEGRPAWVRLGAARYFSHPVPPAAPAKQPRCPADAELTLAVSAAAQREAESRAEQCFARAYEKRRRDWRSVR